MSKQRALELCDEVDRELGYFNIDLLDVIKPLAKAVRELSEDEPEVINYGRLLDGFLDYWGTLVKKGTVSSLTGIEICSLKAFVEWLQEQKPPPKSDPPSPT